MANGKKKEAAEAKKAARFEKKAGRMAANG